MDVVRNIFESTVIGDDDFRRARTLIDTLSDDDIIRETPREGEFLAFIVCKSLFKVKPLGARVVQSFLQRILKIPNVLNKQYKGLTIIDLVIIYSRSDIVYHVLSVADSTTFNDPGRSSCLLFLLMETLEYLKPLRGHIMDLLQKLLVEFEVSPNLEICNIYPLRLEPAEPYSFKDHVFSFLKSRGLLRKTFVNYIGIGGEHTVHDYRNRIRKYLISNNSKLKCNINRETIFSLYLRNANNYRHRDTCVHLILSGKVDLKTIVFIDGIGPTSYQSLLFKKPLKMISQVGGFLISQTPAYLFYIPSAGDPLGAFFQAVSTGWEGYISVSTKDFKLTVSDIFDRRLVRPEMSNIKKYIAHGGIYKYFKKISSRANLSFGQLITRENPENTGLAKILLTPHCLESFILNKIPPRELIIKGARDQYDLLKRKHSRGVDDKPKSINETFFLNEEPVKYFQDGDSCTLFVSEGDHYTFRLEEFQYLIDKRQNPYNRRALFESEVIKLRQLLADYNEWWLIYPSCFFSQEDDEVENSLYEVEVMITEIDEMLNQSPFFMYGERLRPHLLNLSRTGVVRFLYERLLINADSCIPFQTTSTDHSSIEEINICYGILVPRMAETRLGVSVFIQWIYLILDSTRFHSRETLYDGRLICLYNTIMDHLRNLSY